MANPFSIEGYQQDDVDKIKDKYGNTWIHENIAVIPSGTLKVTSNGTYGVRDKEYVEVETPSASVDPHQVETLTINLSQNVEEYNAQGLTVWNKVKLTGYPSTVDNDGIWARRTDDNLIIYIRGKEYPATCTVKLRTGTAETNMQEGAFAANVSFSAEYNALMIVVPGICATNTSHFELTVMTSGGTTLCVIKTQGATLNQYQKRWFSVVRTVYGYQIQTFSGQAITQPNVDKNYITGEFTPQASDNVSGGGIEVACSGFPRIVAVLNPNYVANTNDQKAPSDALFWAMSESPKAGDNALYRFGYISATGSATSSSGTNIFPTAESSKNDDGTTPARAVSMYNGGVKFKTYGDYSFRAGQTYKYWIVM